MSAQKATSKSGIPYLRRGPPGLVKWCNSVLAALDSQRVVRSVDVDAVIQPGGTLLTLRAIQPAPKPQPPSYSPRVVVYSYTPPTPGGPVGGDIKTAIQNAYISNKVTPTSGDFLAGVNGLNYVVYSDDAFVGDLGEYGYSILFFVVNGVTYTAFSVGGAWANGDGF